MNESNRTIDGVAKTIAEVLNEKKYSIDYYQREYKWESKQLAELVQDLTSKFQEVHEERNPRREVAKYPGYYLGSIIISQKGSQPFIVDGQQRLTSLTLFLTFLRRLQANREDKVIIDQLIYSEKFGEKSFNLDVADRVECMNSLFEDGQYDPPADAPESVHTLVARYSEFDELFPEDLKGDSLPYFIDWLKDRVQLVQITAYSDEDAYSIFETMNDRGLKLTPADMLKGYLLSNMEEGEPRTLANDLWRKRLRLLNDRAEDAGSDFIKTWLRSQYAEKIREKSKGNKAEDWDRIGTEFHRWVRKANARIGLQSKQDFFDFVRRDLDFYSRQFENILEAASGVFNSDSPLRYVRFNSDIGFTLQNQLLLAPIKIYDTSQEILHKFELVGRYIDIYVAWRIWNSRTTAYASLKTPMFYVMKEIRGQSIDNLAEILHANLSKIQENFDSNNELLVHQQNRSQIHKLLARITDFITINSGQASNYLELTNGNKVKYEVEHVWAKRPERHIDEFNHDNDFLRHRSHIGGLLLLPKSFNASFGDDPYNVKVKHYLAQNLLAASLNSQTYERNPGFVNFIKRSGLQFKSYGDFNSLAIIERGNLYREIAKQVWNPDDLLTTVNVQLGC